MASRYWVGGTAAWDGTAGTKWAETSGGAGGFSVPTTADDVFFNALSTGTCTIATGNTGAKSLNCTGFTGIISGSGALTVSGSVTLATTMSWLHTGTLTINGTGTLITVGKTLGAITVNGAGITVQLGDALTASARTINVFQGTFTTNNYSVTAANFFSDGTGTRVVNLGSSTLSLSGTAPISFRPTTGLTFNAGTSQINLSSGTTTSYTNVTFYNLQYTAEGAHAIVGGSTFNNLTVGARTTAGVSTFTLDSNQTVSGTLTLSPSAFAAARTFVRSDVIGVPRTLTCAAVAALTDIDFRDITVAGAAAPVSGTRLGDCKGNTGITFDAPKTVYWRLLLSNPWGSSTASWSATDGGTAANTLFPLAQDTAVFAATYPNGGATVTINAAYNIGTVDMSARTLGMALATSANPTIYGNWTNSTLSTMSGVAFISYAGRNTQTITSAGKTFTQGITIDSPGGTVQLADAYSSDISSLGAFIFTNGTFLANNYSVTLTGANSGVSLSGSESRVLSMGSGTWTIAGTNGWAVAPGAVVSGTSVINMSSASSKTFSGGNVQTYPTLRNGNNGALTVFGNNRFAGLTNELSARIQFGGGSVNRFDTFGVSGSSGFPVPLGSTNTFQATLVKPTAWNVGANSTDAGNNTGLSFTGTNPDFLSVSYINGRVAGAGSDVVGVTGAAATAAVGTVQVEFFTFVALTGVSAQAEVGTVTVPSQQNVSVTGVAAQAAVGSATVLLGNVRIFIAGVSSSAAVGYAFVWSLVGDTQDPNWQNTANSQTPEWVPTIDAQNPGWTSVND